MSVGEALCWMFGAKGSRAAGAGVEMRGRGSLCLCSICGPLFQSLIDSFVSFVEESEDGAEIHKFLRDREVARPVVVVPRVESKTESNPASPPS